MADTIEKTLNQARLSSIFPIILIRLTLGLKQIHGKMKATCPFLASFGQRSSKKVIDEQPKNLVARR